MKRPSESNRQAKQIRQRLERRRLSFERVESRTLMAFSPFADIGAISQFPLEVAVAPEPVAVGTINYNASTRVLSIQGSDAYNDRANVYVNHRAGNGAGNLPDLLTVTLENINSPQSYAIDPAAVDKILFDGFGGNDYLENRTAIPLQANGGNGNDVLLGGRGDDLLIGGPGDDFLDGRLGNDTLFGQAGVDALFGDDGIDSLYGGDGTDYLFGGNGADYLYGEAGNDKLYGGAATDKLLGGAGTNTLYTDYGPNTSVSASGFVGFDWFDKNLKDADLREQARAAYRDGVFNRADMLTIFKTVATDRVESAIPNNGVVTTNEFSDLKTLANSKLNFQIDTKYFTQRVVLGDTANAHFQGQALGNLAANVSGDRLTKLVDKWFKGADVPVAVDAKLPTLRYEAVQGSLFVNGPSYEDLDQGAVGDCYFLAALGVVAKHSPSTIQNMFGDNGDGTWTVRFNRGGTTVYVTVNRLLPVFGLAPPGVDPNSVPGSPWAAGWGMHQDEYGATFQNLAYDPANELWVALAEKAYAQLNESGGIGQDGTNSYHGIDLGSEATVIKQLTGKTVSTHSLSYVFTPPSPAGLIKAIQAGQAVTLDTKDSGTNPLLTPNHAYVVTGYNSVTKMFQLYNPHGYWNEDGANRSIQSPNVEADWGAILSNFVQWTSVTL